MMPDDQKTLTILQKANDLVHTAQIATGDDLDGLEQELTTMTRELRGRVAGAAYTPPHISQALRMLEAARRVARRRLREEDE